MSSENPAIWNNPSEMQKINKEKSILDKAVNEWQELHSRSEDAQVLLEMAVEAKDEATFDELKQEVVKLETLAHDLEIKKNAQWRARRQQLVLINSRWRRRHRIARLG